MEDLIVGGGQTLDNLQLPRIGSELFASEFYRFSEKPFGTNPDPKFVYFTPSYQEIFASILIWLMEGEGLAVVTGEAGTGKTFFSHGLISRLDKKVEPVLVLNPVVAFRDLLKQILKTLRVPFHEDTEAGLLQQFAHCLDQMITQGKTPLIILDEAQGLNDGILDGIGRLLNLRPKLIRIIFVGQPCFAERVHSPSFRRIGQKIGFHQEIKPFTEEESLGYIDHRLRLVGSSSDILTPEAISLVCSYTQGISRLINHVCDNAFWFGCNMNRKRIDVDIIKEVIQNLEGPRIIAKTLPSTRVFVRIRKIPARFAHSVFKSAMAGLCTAGQGLRWLRLIPKFLRSIRALGLVRELSIWSVVSVKRGEAVSIFKMKRLVNDLRAVPKKLSSVRPIVHIWKPPLWFAVLFKKISMVVTLFIFLGALFFLVYEYAGTALVEIEAIQDFIEKHLETGYPIHKPSVQQNAQVIPRKDENPVSLEKIPVSVTTPPPPESSSPSPQKETALLRPAKERPPKAISDEAYKKNLPLPSHERGVEKTLPVEPPKPLRDASTQPLTIKRVFAVDKGPYGCVLQIYIDAEDPDGDMDRISLEVEQASYGHYPTEWIIIRPEHRRHLTGFVQWNTFSSKASYLPEGTQISVKIVILDKAGNKSNAVTVPFTFESGVLIPHQLPAPFNKGKISRIGYMMVDLCYISI